MMHVAEASISGLDDSKICSKSTVGYEFSPEDTNCKLLISGGSEKEKPWKLMIYGGKSTEEVESYIEQLEETLEREGGGFDLLKEPEITNLVAGGSLNQQINLEKKFEELSGRGFTLEYEPEQFPAIMLEVKNPSCTVLLFSTGKYILQGVRRIENIEPIIERIKNDIVG